MLKADLHTHQREPFCWTGQVLDAFQGLWRCDSFVQAMRQGTPISTQEFYDDLRHRMRAAWTDAEKKNPQATCNKLATYQSFFAVPFDQNVCPYPLTKTHAFGFASTCREERQPFQTEGTYIEGGNSDLGDSEHSSV